jgi:hypothetical protein
MKKNLGRADVIIRLVVATLLIVLFFTHVISGATGIVLLAVAGVFIVTGLLGVCPLYSLVKISTRKKA